MLRCVKSSALAHSRTVGGSLSMAREAARGMQLYRIVLVARMDLGFWMGMDLLNTFDKKEVVSLQIFLRNVVPCCTCR